ncbi:alpha/beta-hydrolase [Karstenula rhodostoma CBS 690.94]|uniref:Alpha/beta-hydrolase n=1 Tax=Karstenula rhodostoma CBS 690.94 TaxID=1392251 RepID=A0A9P4PX24_9PLEO|nr:alpha/beta-hydrolase [Karstenula rhodostoma CBS 690.94]
MSPLWRALYADTRGRDCKVGQLIYPGAGHTQGHGLDQLCLLASSGPEDAIPRAWSFSKAGPAMRTTRAIKSLCSSRGFRVIALDLREHRRSSAPASIYEYSMKAFVEDVFALLQDLSIGPAIIMAHSMSTIIASILAVERPDMVKALILAHLLYCGTPPALATMSDAMCQNPGAAHMVAESFEYHMYTAQTLWWLRTWHIRRVSVALAGCGQAIVDLFESVVGQTDMAKAFMSKRVAPRLVITMNALPAGAAWEAELGLGT